MIVLHQHLGDQRPGVVGAGLNRAIGARRHGGDQVTRLELRQLAGLRQIVARFAHRTNDVGGHGILALRFIHRNDLVVGVIECRADQVVHRRILNDEMLFGSVLHIDNARHQDAGIGGDHAAGLHHIFEIQVAECALDHGGIFIRMRRHVIAAAIRHTQTTAQIEMADVVARRAQRLSQFRHQLEGLLERCELGDLTADMHVDARDIDGRQFGGAGIDLRCAPVGNTELVLGLAGADLVMCLGIDIRVDPDRHGGALADALGDIREQFELRFRFDIEAGNALAQRQCHFARRLADA